MLAVASPLDVALLLAAGFCAGVLNTVAGAGSALTLPALMFLGDLSASVANGTNRIAVLVQSAAAAASFRRQRVPGLRAGVWLSLPACIGALAGAYLATVLPDEIIRRVFGVVFLGLLFPVVFGSPAPRAEHPIRVTAATVGAFFFLGLYGGFVQVGIGVVILLVLSLLGRGSLVESNHVKVVTVGLYTLAALTVFALRGRVAWVPGLVVGAGSAFGGWFGARMAVTRGERVLRAFLVVAIVATSCELLGVI